MASLSTSPAFMSTLLTYPCASTSTAPPLPPAPPQPPQILKDRLYVGNLHPSVNEYTLLQLFGKHGKVSKLDFLFHKTGLAKGKPRGYAFVEYAAKEDAMRASAALHDRLLRGRKLVVSFAHQAPHTDIAVPGRTFRRPGTDTSKPTTLSLLKTHNRPEATKDKIAALEAKLRQMEAQSHAQVTSSTAQLQILPSSLPQKPLISTVPSVPPGGAQARMKSGKATPQPLRHRPSSASLGIAIKR